MHSIFHSSRFKLTIIQTLMHRKQITIHSEILKSFAFHSFLGNAANSAEIIFCCRLDVCVLMENPVLLPLGHHVHICGRASFCAPKLFFAEEKLANCAMNMHNMGQTRIIFVSISKVL